VSEHAGWLQTGLLIVCLCSRRHHTLKRHARERRLVDLAHKTISGALSTSARQHATRAASQNHPLKVGPRKSHYESFLSALHCAVCCMTNAVFCAQIAWKLENDLKNGS
jgi:hypothetical protein